MNLVLMHFSNPVSWVFMPQLVKRVKEFAIKYGLDYGPDIVEEAVRINFVSKHPTLFALVAVEGSKVVGHVVTTVDSLTNFDGTIVKRYLTILQAAHETKMMDDDFRDAVVGNCREWARATNCDSIQILCEGEHRVKLFRDKYGFKEHKTVMHLNVEE